MGDKDQRTYQGFMNIDRHIIFDDPTPDQSAIFGIRWSLYEALPADGDMPDRKKFVPLATYPTNAFVEVADAKRYLDPDKRKEDYGRIPKTADQYLWMPFHMWDSNGKPLRAPPNNLIPDVWVFRREKDWCDELLGVWKHRWDIMQLANPKVPWNNYMRFHQPKKDTKITLIFTPPDKAARFNDVQLRELFLRLVEEPENITVKFMTHSGASKKNLVLLSKHFFSFYWTWVSAQDFVALCTDRGVQDLNRPWPRQEVAETIYDERLGGDSSNPKNVKEEETFDVNINYTKMESAAGKRKDFPDQQTVMGNVSATDWLHRSAFRFGGLTNEGPGSSQVRKNLIFGTSECNTHMMRAENTISMFVSMQSEADSTKKHKGSLKTENIRKGGVLQLQNNGGRKNKEIEPWVMQKKYSRQADHSDIVWLSMGLKFVWTTTDGGSK
ncbi:hypothetical protein CPB86DRAFT_803222, partial [Serendipita vermifera]